NGALRALLGLPTSGSPSLLIAILSVAILLWAYHARVLHQDIVMAGESSLQAGMQRLYWYLVAALGFAALVVGLAGELSVAVHWLAVALRADSALKEQFAQYTAVLAAGLPVWLMAWLPAQRAAVRDDAVGMTSRRSVLRKLYLYSYAFAAVLMMLANAVVAVNQLLNALFGIFGGSNLFADI